MMWDHEASAEEIALAAQLFEEAEVILKDVRSRDVNEEDPEIQKLLVLYTQLTDIGCIDAMYAMGLLYHGDSHYILRDRVKALYWFEEAANLGHKDAMYKLACMYEGKPGMAYKWLEMLTEMDDIDEYECQVNAGKYADAYFRKAELLLSGLGCQQNTDKAIELYIAAAFYGEHYEAQFILACMYLGYGSNPELFQTQVPVTPNYKNAANLLKMASEHETGKTNLYKASYLYATLLIEGKGVRKQPIEGYKLLYAAAKKGCQPAFLDLAEIYKNGLIFDPDYQMAYRSILLYQESLSRESKATNDMIEEIEAKLSKADILRIQQESRADYFADALSAENYLKEHLSLDNPAVSVETANESSEAEIVDPKHSKREEYVFKKGGLEVDKKGDEYKEIIKNFNPENVTFTIWLDEPFRVVTDAEGNEQREPLDFMKLRVGYGPYSIQEKDMGIYANKKCDFGPQKRILMFRLAVAKCVFNDDRLFEYLINEKKNETQISKINTLFKLLFPFWKNNSPVIKRIENKLIIKLKIGLDKDTQNREAKVLVDTWVKHSSDYIKLVKLQEKLKILDGGKRE